MLVLHAFWSRNRLNLWAEDSARALATDTDDSTAPLVHPYAAEPAAIRAALVAGGFAGERDFGADGVETLTLPFWVPPQARERGTSLPMPGDRLAGILAIDEDLRLEAHAATSRVPCVTLPPAAALATLVRMSTADHAVPVPGVSGGLAIGVDVRYWTATARFLADLLVDQRFVPTLVQDRDGEARAQWIPWLSDAKTEGRLGVLIESMPAASRAAVDDARGQPWPILESALHAMTDAYVRQVLAAENFGEAIEDRDPTGDPHVAWLAGLLNGSTGLPGSAPANLALLRGARSWLAQLDDVTEGRLVRLCLELNEPDAEVLTPEQAMAATWRLRFKLVTTDEPPVFIDAEQVWEQGGSSLKGLLASLGGDGDTASDLLLAELARAGRIYSRIEKALDESTPTGLDLTTAEAYHFLREYRAILAEAGFEILVPSWWGQSASRLGARLLIESEPSDGGSTGGERRGELGLNALVGYTWQVALGDRPISLDELRALAATGSPLVKLNGQWVEIRPDDLQGASKFLAEHPGGQMTLLEALRLAHGLEGSTGSLPILGLDATGWVGDLLRSGGVDEKLNLVEQPANFRGELRPYQRAGLSWMAFLDRFGLGACLADDMGLGKTIQLIALLQHERSLLAPGEKPGPTLLVAPMSVVGNWARELGRFAPELSTHVHHGLERPSGARFEEIAKSADVTITTYALVTRDREALARLHWRRVVLDEAQHIKNPPTKQTAAIRSLRCSQRIALTGTPVENRLTELWSIMEFCSPGYLGTQGDFRRRFAVPIERHRDRRQAERLRALVRPFVLRRVKTDPKVITDLPPLVESRQIVPLTDEQTRLYSGVVNDMLKRVDMAEGIRRRGLVLSALVKLKQICNHPAHFLKEEAATAATAKAIAEADDGIGGLAADASVSARSGKSIRLIEMLEELLAGGNRALIFTQYRQMGHLLVSMIRRELDTEALFLHGGTPQVRREELVDRFQSGDPAVPIFVLSLKAGGVGLNLTSANHVFHYDRWWNPAVENQATDRAFRIGQTRTVNVHKMISADSLEERIDQMIEQKTELASQIISAGDSGLTELSTGQLRELLSLRRNAMEDDA
jgi:SNF2 family DNA or RNA helicase